MIHQSASLLYQGKSDTVSGTGSETNKMTEANELHSFPSQGWRQSVWSEAETDARTA